MESASAYPTEALGKTPHHQYLLGDRHQVRGARHLRRPASRKAGKVRITSINPGAVDSELKLSSSDEASTKTVNQFYEQAIPADSVARAIAFAIYTSTAAELDGSINVTGSRLDRAVTTDQTAVCRAAN